MLCEPAALFDVNLQLRIFFTITLVLHVTYWRQCLRNLRSEGSFFPIKAGITNELV